MANRGTTLSTNIAMNVLFFMISYTSNTLVLLERLFIRSIWWRGGYGRIDGGRWALQGRRIPSKQRLALPAVHLHSSTKVRTRFRNFASRKCNRASILLTNILKSQAMLLRAKWNAPTTARGEFEHCRACVLGVIAPAPVRHALSNSRRAW
jgi:hypothetical protein